MFFNQLEANHKFAIKFFNSAIKKDIGHAYCLIGSDIEAQYYIALEVARIINCKAEKNHGCECNSCKWSYQNRHPAIITVSPVDFDSVKKGNSKTVISVDQAREIRRELSISSPHHRVVIFLNAEEKENKSLYNIPAPFKNDEERDWQPLPLTRETFQTAAANTLLKTFEEPLGDVTFFFLAKDKEDIIETIISRCQSIPVSARFLKNEKTSNVEYLKFNPKNAKEAMKQAQLFVEHAKTLSAQPKELLIEMQNHYRNLLEANVKDKFSSIKIVKNIELIEKTIARLNSSVNAQSAIDDMFLLMAGR